MIYTSTPRMSPAVLDAQLRLFFTLSTILAWSKSMHLQNRSSPRIANRFWLCKIGRPKFWVLKIMQAEVNPDFKWLLTLTLVNMSLIPITGELTPQTLTGYDFWDDSELCGVCPKSTGKASY